MRFEWDEDKNKVNKIKHGVSFEEAKTVFDDKDSIFLHDENHSFDEERFILIGLDSLFRELMVCHCYRGCDDETVRIISARKATKGEVNLYQIGVVE